MKCLILLTSLLKTEPSVFRKTIKKNRDLKNDRFKKKWF